MHLILGRQYASFCGRAARPEAVASDCTIYLKRKGIRQGGESGEIHLCALWSGRREVSFCNSCTHRAHFIVVYRNAL